MKEKQLIMVAILAISSKLDYIVTTVTGDTWTKLTNRITSQSTKRNNQLWFSCFSGRWALVYDVIRMMSTQFCWQRSLRALWELHHHSIVHENIVLISLRECIGSSFPLLWRRRKTYFAKRGNSSEEIAAGWQITACVKEICLLGVGYIQCFVIVL